MPNLTIVIASTRPGRAALPIAQWFEQRARQHGAFDISIADLAEIDLPLLDEPNHPRFADYTKQHTRDWSARVAAADAFVFVMPEYNHSMSPALINAIDYVYNEWNFKPLGLVSYGGVSAGLRAAQQLKQIAFAVKLIGITEAVAIPFAAQFIDEEGVFRPNEITEQAATTMLDELLRVESVTRALRADVHAHV
jgi:NAD(P)H-dependent FMN reductase